MHDRRTDYARCTASLIEDRRRAGAAAIYDEALTNGLASIVARRWQGAEMAGEKVKAAAALLRVIEQRGEQLEQGVYQLEDLERPHPGVVIFGGSADPEPTIVRVALLLNGIEITQPARHARPQAHEPLREEHVEALKLLNVDASLRRSFEEFDLEEFEERVALADSRERGRAREYIRLLAVEEWERREAIDYEAEYTEVEDDERFPPHECPFCGLQALIADAVDGYVGEFVSGTCVACAYTKSYAIADLEGRDEAIERAVHDPSA